MTRQLLFPLLLLVSIAQGQVIRSSGKPVYAGLAAYSNRLADAFSFRVNQGSLASAKSFSAGAYSERRFSLQALSASSVAVIIPTHSGNFGFGGDLAGDPAYKESAAGISYARNLGSKAAVGVQFDYINLKAAGYGGASTLSFDMASLFHLADNLTAGLRVHNPVAKSFGKDGTEKLPAVYTAGVGYDVSPQVFIGCEAEKAEGQPVGLNAGIYYQVAGKLMTRLGLQTATRVYAFGFGVQLNNFRLDATVALHSYLGATPGLLLLYTPKE